MILSPGDHTHIERPLADIAAEFLCEDRVHGRLYPLQKYRMHKYAHAW